MEFGLCETFYWKQLFYPQWDSLRVVPSPDKKIFVESILLSIEVILELFGQALSETLAKSI